MKTPEERAILFEMLQSLMRAMPLSACQEGYDLEKAVRLAMRLILLLGDAAEACKFCIVLRPLVETEMVSMEELAKTKEWEEFAQKFIDILPEGEGNDATGETSEGTPGQTTGGA